MTDDTMPTSEPEPIPTPPVETAPTPPVPPSPPPAPPDPTKPPEPKPYAEVITAEAVSQTGLWRVHQVGHRWFMELPPAIYGRDILWYAEFAESPLGVAVQPKALGTRIIRWDREENRVFLTDWTNTLRLRLPFQSAETAEQKAEEQAVAGVARPAITVGFPVAAEGEDGSAVIDVTAFFTQNLLEFDVANLLKASGYMAGAVDPGRSRIDKIHAFPKSLLLHTTLTFALASGSSSAATIGLTHSMVTLPDPPLLPRYFDPRVGYFVTEFGVVSADDDPGITRRQVISRYRLEKKRPDAKVSEPKQPITFYLPPEIPAKWRPYVRQGVEDWQPAFETAGFRKAIIARDAPTPEEDPDWDPADARYSVIRWVPQPFPNAMGPHLADPRTGEILSSHVIFWDDVLKIAQQWYFTQVSAVDERARALPLPDDVLGEVIRYIVCHEVGHAIGLRHNHRASQAFTTEQLRDPKFAAAHGPVASIMSYGRFNYVTQPGDGVERLMPMIGPYDHFAINWGYRPVPGATSPEAEEPVLDEWASAVKSDPWLAFGGEDAKASVDPTVLTENIGADRIDSARLGIANLERMLEFLVPATTREHEDFELLSQMYRGILNNRTTWLLSAAKELGGVSEQRLLDPTAEVYVRVPAERQRAIVAFLLENLRRAAPFLRPDIVNRVAPFNAIKPVMDSQLAVLDRMLAGGIYKQIMDAAILEPDIAYPLAEYLGDMQDGLFAELKMERPVVDTVMRTLQRHYLTTIKQLLAAYENPVDPMLLGMLESMGIPADQVEFSLSSGQGTDYRNAARTVLRELRGELVAAQERCNDSTTKAHLEDLLVEVEAMLDRKGG